MIIVIVLCHQVGEVIARCPKDVISPDSSQSDHYKIAPDKEEYDYTYNKARYEMKDLVD